MEHEINRDFKGVWIPKEIYLNPDLSWTEKMLLVEINSLDTGEGCFASNEYLGKFLGKSASQIANTISRLRSQNWVINRRFDGRKRYISVKAGLRKTVKHSNTVNNTVSNKDIPRNSIEFELSELLFSEIQKRKPDYKKPNLRVWAKDIDLMIRLDKRKPDKIREVIIWCQQDSGNGSWHGWQNNILSIKKLREKFDKLELSMGRTERTHQNGNQEPNQREPIGLNFR